MFYVFISYSQRWTVFCWILLADQHSAKRSSGFLYNLSGCTDFRALCFIRWMYWTDWEEDPKESKRGRIERAWMDGSNRTVFLSSKTVLWPNGLSLDIPQGVLYWVDAYYDRIEMVYLNSSERKVSTRSAALHITLFLQWSGRIRLQCRRQQREWMVSC